MFRKDYVCLFHGILTAQALCTSNFHLSLSQRVSALQRYYWNVLYMFKPYICCLNADMKLCYFGGLVGVPERSHSVLLQYSVNGGISWMLLDEFYFPTSTDTLFLHLALPSSAQTNATRFRLWQPYNNGEIPQNKMC